MAQICSRRTGDHYQVNSSTCIIRCNQLSKNLVSRATPPNQKGKGQGPQGLVTTLAPRWEGPSLGGTKSRNGEMRNEKLETEMEMVVTHPNATAIALASKHDSNIVIMNNDRVHVPVMRH